MKNQSNIDVDSAVIEAKRLAFNVDYKASNAPNYRSFGRVSWMAIPKHINGNSSYVVTASVGRPYPRDRSRHLHYWSALGDGTGNMSTLRQESWARFRSKVIGACLQ